MKLATLCYVKDKNKKQTLMIHRIKKQNDMHKDKWNGLGGKVEPGESPEECVTREVLEESGLTITSPKLHGFITFPKFDGNDDWYVFIFTADQFDGELIDSLEGKLEWVPDEKMLELNLWEGDRIFLKWLSEDKFFSAKFTYNLGQMTGYKVEFY